MPVGGDLYRAGCCAGGDLLLAPYESIRRWGGQGDGDAVDVNVSYADR
jgi:hypothetical protein